MYSLFGPTKNAMSELITLSEEANIHAEAQYISNKGCKPYDTFGWGADKAIPIPRNHTLRGNDALLDDNIALE